MTLKFGSLVRWKDNRWGMIISGPLPPPPRFPRDDISYKVWTKHGISGEFIYAVWLIEDMEAYSECG